MQILNPRIFFFIFLSFLGVNLASTPAQEPSLFLRIYHEKLEPILLENEGFFVLFDAHPLRPGHVLIIPKRQVTSSSELDPYEWMQYGDILGKTKTLLLGFDFKGFYESETSRIRGILSQPDILDPRTRLSLERHLYYYQNCLEFLKQRKAKTQSLAPIAFNLFENDGQTAGQTILHLHIQVIPRFENDVTDSRFGCRRFLDFENRADPLSDYTVIRRPN